MIDACRALIVPESGEIRAAQFTLHQDGSITSSETWADPLQHRDYLARSWVDQATARCDDDLYLAIIKSSITADQILDALRSERDLPGLHPDQRRWLDDKIDTVTRSIHEARHPERSIDVREEPKAPASSGSDGGTGSGGGSNGDQRSTSSSTPSSSSSCSSAGGSCVGDALRELREALERQRKIWPDAVQCRLPDCELIFDLHHAVDAMLKLDISAIELRAIQAEAKVKELEDYTSQLIWNVTNGKLSKPFTGIPDICEVIAQQQDEQVEKATATLTRQLAEEREACDAMRRRHGYPENFRGRTIHCCVTQAGDFRCSDCRAHDARREREKQNKGGAGEPAPRQTETAGPDIERDEESLRTSGASNHPQSAAITNNGGRPIGAGSGAAAVQSESTGEARSGGTPRVPANNRSGPHAAGDAAPILNKDETAQADPQTVASGLSTSNPPATVTEEDREMVVAAWKSHYGLTPLETITEIFATLLARVRSSARKELDEAVDVLGTMVEPLRYWAGYDGLCDRAAAIVNRHREVGR